ncbi:MAG: type IV secretory system conjugative DNA transfer family protein, partial [Sneathiella sp.]|nr:type IV secretory system conjugative DNA transfer family protein [Sneathiella sp.]
MADFGSLSHTEMIKALEAMLESNAGDGYVAQEAKNWLEQYREPCEQWAWVMSEFRSAWGLYGKGSTLRAHTSATEFDVRDLKSNPRAVYFVFPDLYVDSHGKHASIMLDFLLSQLATATGNVRTTILADEFSNFPRVQSMLKSLRLYRSKLIRIFTFSQDENGFNAYKDDGGFAPFKENSVCIYIGAEGKIATDLTLKAGNRTERVVSYSSNSGVTNTGAVSAPETLRPVLLFQKFPKTLKEKPFSICEKRYLSLIAR